MEKLNIIIADDHYIFRKGLKKLISKIDFAGIIEEASNGKEVLELLACSSYHIVLLDIEMPILNGIETLEIVKQKHPSVKVMMLSSFSDEGQIEELYKRKIDGYLLKDIDFSELERALANALEGREYFCQEVAGKLFQKLLSKSEPAKHEITAREEEILLMICDQWSSQEIAEKLNLSARTIDRFRENLLAKTDSKNSIGIVLYAIKHGIKKL
jgi:DNA-binding NarL/FixJ family response regulator